METNNTNAMEKTRIYNLIILDESGSMCTAFNSTISGCNETLQTIEMTQEKYPDTQENLVSIYAFQTGSVPSRYLVKNVPAGAAEKITKKDYCPGGCTPLYDAIGACIVDLKHSVKSHPNAIASITIITDGYENSSKQYTGPQVAKMIDQVKEMGWNVNFIGANIDVEAVAQKLNIDNYIKFSSDEEGTSQMFATHSVSRMAFADTVHHCMEMPMSAEEEADPEKARILRLKKASKNFFKK